MAFETITIATLLTQMARKLNNSDTIDPNLVTEAQFSLECAYRDIVQESGMGRVITQVTTPVTLVTGTATYGLDDSLYQLVEESVRIVETPRTTLVPMTRQWFDHMNATAAQATGIPTHYMMVGASSSTGKQQITFWPTPSSTANGKTITYMGAFTLASILGSATSATLDKRMPPEWHHYLPFGALTLMPTYLSDSDWQKFKVIWQDYKKEARRTSGATIGNSYQHDRFETGRMQGPNRTLLANWPLSP